MEDLPKIKILRCKGKSEKVFIDGHEIKGVTSIKISNSTVVNSIDATSVIIEIGYMDSVEIVSD